MRVRPRARREGHDRGSVRGPPRERRRIDLRGPAGIALLARVAVSRERMGVGGCRVAPAHPLTRSRGCPHQPEGRRPGQPALVGGAREAATPRRPAFPWRRWVRSGKLRCIVADDVLPGIHRMPYILVVLSWTGTGADVRRGRGAWGRRSAGAC
jgi:hypothetical protein